MTFTAMVVVGKKADVVNEVGQHRRRSSAFTYLL
jgi:hypothetical protein